MYFWILQPYKTREVNFLENICIKHGWNANFPLYMDCVVHSVYMSPAVCTQLYNYRHPGLVIILTLPLYLCKWRDEWLVHPCIDFEVIYCRWKWQCTHFALFNEADYVMQSMMGYFRWRFRWLFGNFTKFHRIDTGQTQDGHRPDTGQ